MNVRLIAVTESMMDGVLLSAEELLVYIARVSNPENQLNTDTADKLIAYLIKRNHWSPFDMVNLIVEVKTSRMIAQQILRHWSIKPQEFSQRYSAAVEVEPIELRKQGEKNRQSSEDLIDDHIEFLSYQDDWTSEVNTGFAKSIIDSHVRTTLNLYNALLAKGVSKETARQILPLATSTTMYLNGSVRSWIHYLQQRTDPHAQKEHRIVAQAIEHIFELIFPNVFKAIKA